MAPQDRARNRTRTPDRSRSEPPARDRSGPHPRKPTAQHPAPSTPPGTAAPQPRGSRSRPHNSAPGPRSVSTRKSLSQNFLRDPGVIRRIVRAARPGPDDLIVEVGAGEGLLTRALAAECRKVVAYELDARLAARLTARTRDDDTIRCVHGDFLAARPPREPFSLVGNIPYAVTSSIVAWCLDAPGLGSATLVTQWEYARKRTGDYGRWSQLTVRTWPRFAWTLLGRIPRRMFRPVPRVDSGIMRIDRRRGTLLPGRDLGAYARLVDLGFSGTGGSLYATLRRHHPARRVAAAFRAAGIAQDMVVAYVHPGQWVELYRVLYDVSTSGRGGFPPVPGGTRTGDGNTGDR